jgi:hypothetical protein
MTLTAEGFPIVVDQERPAEELQAEPGLEADIAALGQEVDAVNEQKAASVEAENDAAARKRSQEEAQPQFRRVIGGREYTASSFEELRQVCPFLGRMPEHMAKKFLGIQVEEVTEKPQEKTTADRNERTSEPKSTVRPEVIHSAKHSASVTEAVVRQEVAARQVIVAEAVGAQVLEATENFRPAESAAPEPTEVPVVANTTQSPDELQEWRVAAQVEEMIIEQRQRPL